MNRHRRALIVAAASALLVGVAPPLLASAAAGGADLVVWTYPPTDPVANDADSVYQVNVENDGDDLGGGTGASGVVLTMSVSGGATVRSVADITGGSAAATATCTKVDTTHATCVFPTAVAVDDARYVKLVVTGGADGSTETVDASASETPASADPDHSNDSYETQVGVVTPPPASMSASSSFDPQQDGVIVTATVTAGGQPVSGDEVDVYARPAAGGTYEQVGYSDTGDDGTHLGTAHIYVDSGTNAALFSQTGSFTFEVVHPATSQADAVTKTLTVTPRPVTVTLTVPSSVTYSQTSSETIHGTAALPDDPAVYLNGSLVLQSRPAGSSGAWKTVGSTYASGAADFYESAVHNTDYRMLYSSVSPGSATSVSPVKSLAVKQAVHEVISPAAIPPGDRSSVRVTVGPVTSGGSVTLQRLAGKVWKTVATTKLSAGGSKTWTYRFSKVTTASYRVRAGATSTNAANVSSVRALTVERHGGGKAKDHTFLYATGVHSYARWNPCRAIHYRVNVSEAPKQALADVKETLHRISQISRLRYVYDGQTSFIPSQNRHQKEPLVIAWARPNQTDLGIGTGPIGVGGGAFEENTVKNAQVTTGYAVLLAGYKLTPGFGAGATEGALLMHELGHAMGLNHTLASSQIMYPTLLPHPSTMYGAGDYRGLQLVGRSQGCIPKLQGYRISHVTPSGRSPYAGRVAVHRYQRFAT